jgi:hypothetical protein
MVLKKYQNPKGGLNEAGRQFYKKTEGLNLKSPLKSGDSSRRASFLARMAGNDGPEYKDGKPTRLLLSLKDIFLSVGQIPLRLSHILLYLQPL